MANENIASLLKTTPRNNVGESDNMMLLPSHELLNPHQILLQFKKNAAKGKIGFREYLKLCKLYFNYNGFEKDGEQEISILFNLEEGEIIINRKDVGKIPECGFCSESPKILCFKAAAMDKVSECIAIKSSCLEKAIKKKFRKEHFDCLDLWLGPPHIVVQHKNN